MKRAAWLGLWVGVSVFSSAHGAPLPIVVDVDYQPLASQARRVMEALHYLGEPLPSGDAARLRAALRSTDPNEAVKTIQRILDQHVLVAVEINPESRVKARLTGARAELVQQGWRSFLVKVHNEAGVRAALEVASPNAAPIYRASNASSKPKKTIEPVDVPHRFLDVMIYRNQPMTETLSGLTVEYVILQAYCRDKGKREAMLSFHVGQGTQDIGFRSEVPVLFEAKPAAALTVRIKEADGSPTTGSLLIRDRLKRVYPSPTRRLAPDFFFHPQIYRHDGETVLLPPGEYTVDTTRGPEYRVEERRIVMPEKGDHEETFVLHRWIEPKKLGWWSGDHHVHAAGCKHYENPTEGVRPEDMFRHQLGEDLNVGCVLSWGPCWYFQKQFFEGKVHALSRPNYVMRYDVEVSGFPSSHSGHLCLLRLREDDYPGSSRIEDWPSWDLPVLQWGKKQGGVVGFSHSGWGLQTKSTALPNEEIPPFNGIGANEYIVDVVHDAVDFISAVDTPIPYELNIWYHTLNCGYRARISGETDFPCIYGERVGLGRVYVKLDGKLDFDAWAEGIKQGRSYCSDGLSHLIDFQVNDRGLGENGSVLSLAEPKTVRVRAKAAALLPTSPDVGIKRRRLDQQPYWHLERAREGTTRTVPVEVIVNGKVAAKRSLTADGSMKDVEFDVPIERSSWIALRVFASSHTNPVFVEVGGKPVRASRKSAQWCLKCVDQCWKQKRPAIRQSERAEAEAAFAKARESYRRILDESEVD